MTAFTLKPKREELPLTQCSFPNWYCVFFPPICWNTISEMQSTSQGWQGRHRAPSIPSPSEELKSKEVDLKEEKAKENRES